MTLLELPVDQQARVTSLEESNANVVRLAELGLIVGQTVKVNRRAPLGDPIHISVMRHELCLRAQDARSVFVESIP